MKKIILKVIIGIVAVPTVVIGGLYIAREIPVVNEKVVMPLAKITSNIGIPIVKSKYTDEMARKCIGNLKYIYYNQKFDCQGKYPNYKVDSIEQWLEKSGCLNLETRDYQNINAINNGEGFGTEYFILLYSENEGYNLTWREYLEAHLNVVESKIISKTDIDKVLKLDLEENIPMNDLTTTNSDDNDIYEKNKKLTELSDELQEAMKNGDNEKEKQIQQQIEQLEKEIEEYNKNNEITTKKSEEVMQKYNELNQQYNELNQQYLEACVNKEDEKAEQIQKQMEELAKKISDLMNN